MPATRPKPGRSPKPAEHQLRTRVWSAGRLLVLAVLLGITFATFFLTSMRVATRAREVAVPELRGRPLADVNRTLADAGLVLRIEARRPDAKVPIDHVLEQDPAPGTVLRPQRAVRVRVSDGQRDPVVPAVVGQAERTAEIILAQENVEIAGRAEIRTTSYPAGTIVGQNPPPKDRAPAVMLLVNRGERGQSYVMPDLIGTLEARAIEVLRRRPFRVVVGARVPYPGLQPGVIVQQMPRPGYQVGFGDTVTLEVSQ
jgi:beta-lactam-binding protein with PASTA domain